MIVAVLAPVRSRDLGVVHAVVEQADDRPALGHVAQLAERAQVAEEALGLVAVVEAQDRVEQRLGLRRSPVVGHGSAVLPAGCDRSGDRRVLPCYRSSVLKR